MDWRDIIPWGSDSNAKSKNKAHYRSSVTTEMSKEHRKFVDENLINLDVEIYKQANEMLDKRIEAYGKLKLEGEIEKYFGMRMKPEFPEEFLPSATKSQHFWKASDLSTMKEYRERNGGGCVKGVMIRDCSDTKE